MTSFTGIIDEVRLVTLGSVLSADAALGATVLNVIDTTDYDGNRGGTVGINGQVVAYNAVDETASTVTLAVGLTAAALAEDLVAIWDVRNGVAATEMRAALNTADDIDAGSAITARVNLSVVPLLPVGYRDTGAGEVATAQRIDGEWVVTDLPGVTPVVRGELLAPSSIKRSALGFILPGGATVYISATDPHLDPTITLYQNDLWLFVDPGAPANNNILSWDTATTAWVQYQIGTQVIAANAVIAGAIAAGAIDAFSITAVTIQGSIQNSVLDDSDVIIDDGGGRLLAYAATTAPTVTTVITTGAGTFTVPAGVTTLKVECHAAGSGGGCSRHSGSVNLSGYGGYGGGYVSHSTYPVTPGEVINYSVGAGGAGAATGGDIYGGTAGGDTWFRSSTDLKAYGGSKTNQARSGIGPSGVTKFTGGWSGGNWDDASGGSVPGAGGGEGASSKGNGNKGQDSPHSGTTGGAGGTGNSGGGNGGDGGTTTTAGGNGSAPGGAGGSGGINASGTTRAGGAGADGKLIITYNPPGGLVLVASAAAASGTDAKGYSYPSGVNIQPRYYRTCTFSKALVTATADTVSATTQVKLLSYDGLTRFSSGTYVVPAGQAGQHDIEFFADNLLTNANNARMAIQVNGVAVSRTIYTGGGGGVNTFSVGISGLDLAVGDVVSFSMITAGPNVTVTGTIMVRQTYVG